MNENVLFKQMEKITGLAILIIVASVLMAGVVLQDTLANNLEDRETRFICGTPSPRSGVALNSVNKLDGDSKTGKSLFLEKCASCHNIDMMSDMTGPALYGAVDRWGNRDDLYQWVRDYSVLVEQGHPRAVMMEKWSPTTMTAFPDLDSIELRNIFAYIEGNYGY